MFTFDICDDGYHMNSKLTMEHSLDYIDKTVKKYFENIEIHQIKTGRLEQNKEVGCGLVIVKKFMPQQWYMLYSLKLKSTCYPGSLWKI